MEYLQATVTHSDRWSEAAGPLNPFFHLSGGGVEMIVGSLSFDPTMTSGPQPITLTLQDASGSVTVPDSNREFGYSEGGNLIEISNYDSLMLR
jgi:hypothetical protein